MNWYHGGDSYIHVTHNDPFTLSQILDLSFRNTLMPNNVNILFHPVWHWYTTCWFRVNPLSNATLW